MERITALLAPLPELGDTYLRDFYNEYLERTGGNAYTAEQPDDEIETAIYGVPREMPTGFSREIRTQREIYNMLYFLLDIAAPGLETRNVCISEPSPYPGASTILPGTIAGAGC